MGYLDDIIIYSRSEKKTLTTLQQTKSSRTQTQTGEMLFLQEAHTISRTLNISRKKPAPPRKTGKHSKNASPKEPKGSETISWFSRLLSKIRTQVCRHFMSTNTPNQKECKIQMDPRM